jgi:hypothetical protein
VTDPPASNTAQQEPTVATEPTDLYLWWLNARPASDEDAEQPSTHSGSYSSAALIMANKENVWSVRLQHF